MGSSLPRTHLVRQISARLLKDEIRLRSPKADCGFPFIKLQLPIIIIQSNEPMSESSMYETQGECVQLVIEIDSDHKVPIQISRNSNPNQLACCFCYDHNLDFKVIPVLAGKIKQLKEDAYGEQEDGEAIFSKMYEPGRSDNISQTSVNPIKSSRISSTSSSNLNRGQMLYQRNSRLQQEKKRNLQKIQQKLKSEQQKQLTFQPKINVLSRILALRLQEDSQPFHIKNQMRRINKSLLYRAEKEKSAMQQCTFQPRINAKSPMANPNRYQSLYNDNFARQNRLNKASKLLDGNLSFHPEVNRLSSILVGGVSFQQRLSRDRHQRDNRLNGIAFSIEKKNKHRPLTGRPPQIRNIQNLPIGQYLYNRPKRSIAATPTSKPQLVNSRSQKMYMQKKISVFTIIFQYLDVDGDGLVKYQSVDDNSLSYDAWQMIYPVVQEMKEMRVSLNLEEFANSLDELFKTLGPIEKNKFLNLFKINGDEENCMTKSYYKRVPDGSVKSSQQASIQNRKGSNSQYKIKAFR